MLFVKSSLVLLFFVSSSLVWASSSSLKNELRVSSVQYPIEGKKTVEEVFQKVESYVKEAKKQNAEMVVFPEWIALDMWPLGLEEKPDVIVKNIAESFTQKYMRFLKSLASKHRMLIVGGSAPKIENSKIYNSAFVAFPNSNLIEHKKVYLTKWEIETGLSASDSLTTFDTPWGKMALLICYDVEFPDVSVELKDKEFSLIIVSSMTESKSGVGRVSWASKARAVEHTSYVVLSPTQGKTTKTWIHYGKAMFLTPQLSGLPGLLKEGDNEAGVVTATFDMKKLRQLKKSSSWRPAKQIRDRD